MGTVPTLRTLLPQIEVRKRSEKSINIINMRMSNQYGRCTPSIHVQIVPCL